jgi:hypothetical protein
MGLKYLWAKKREKLKREHIAKRKLFAEKLQQNHAFRIPIIFTDESMFVLDSKKEKLYRFPGENSEDVFREHEGYAIKIMIWGAIGHNYRSPLIWFKEHVTKITYVDELRKKQILEDLWVKFPHGYIFQQDNARPHTAAYARDYITRLAQTLPEEAPWPPCSPDLSPIEQIWAYIKKKVNMKAVKTAEDLFKEVERIWLDMDDEMINNYVDSFQSRIWTLEDVGGHSLAGHKDMIHVYEKKGLTDGRNIARRLMHSHQLPANWISQCDKFIAELKHHLNPRCSPKFRAYHLRNAEDEWARLRSLLPLGHHVNFLNDLP